MFKPTTVDSILSAHKKTIDQLEAHAVASDNRATCIDDEISRKIAERDSNLAESKRALSIAAKFREILA